ncbi:3-hydroxy-fatty acyl-ACP dehydratase [Alphaproteobacteria bacterium]|nr:3-hydroxy-fatty acyl-ACP dehydratase [Alphaproteobacteria bacterium]
MSAFLSPENYLPHRAPMLLIEEVRDVGKEQACCRVVVRKDGVLAPFLDDKGGLPGWFAAEIMAQTAGIWSGWNRREQGDAENRPGMLLGVRALCCKQPSFPCGSVLDATVRLSMRDEKLGSFEAEILCLEKVAASARLTVYQPDDRELKTLFRER